MKKLQAVIIAASAVLLAACGSGSTGSAPDTTAAGYTTQNVTDFAATIAAGAIVIDVRRPDEYAAGHINGAVNINVEDANFATQIEQLDKSATYAVYCHSGRRSLIVVEQMASDGFTSIYNLDGGIQAWTGAGQALTQ